MKIENSTIGYVVDWTANPLSTVMLLYVFSQLAYPWRFLFSVPLLLFAYIWVHKQFLERQLRSAWEIEYEHEVMIDG